MNPVERARDEGVFEFEGRVYRRTEVGALHVVCDLSICGFCKMVNADRAKGLVRKKLEIRCPAIAFKDRAGWQSPTLCCEDTEMWAIDLTEADNETG